MCNLSAARAKVRSSAKTNDGVQLADFEVGNIGQNPRQFFHEISR